MLKIFYVTIFFQLLFHHGNSSLRFCYEGMWHELRETDCTYGLYFHSPIIVPCFYTTNNDHSIPRIWPNICTEPFVNMPDTFGMSFNSSHHPLIAAQKQAYFQMIRYNMGEDPSIDTPTWDDVVTIEECENLCRKSMSARTLATSSFLNSEEDIETETKPESHEKEDSFETYTFDLTQRERYYALPNNETLENILRDQTLRLGDHLYDRLENSDKEFGPNLRVVSLFKTSIEIVKRTCPHPFVHQDFLSRIQDGFLFLLTDVGIGHPEDVSQEEYEDILNALTTCKNKEPSFRVEGSICPSKSLIKEIVVIDKDTGIELEADFAPAHLPEEDRKFPYKYLDIVIESAWKIVTMVHAHCFQDFKGHANMLHKYVSVMKTLFDQEKMKVRWENPTQLIDDRMWGSWFLVDVDTTYVNMHACIRAAYLESPFKMKLDRPIDTPRDNVTPSRRKKRAIRRKPVISYWKKYHEEGGVMSYFADSAICFEDSDEQRIEYIAENIKCDEK